MKTTIKTGKKLDDLQVNKMVELITNQKNTKALTEQEFYSNLLRSFVDTFDSNPFYKKTPKVFLSLTVFYIQASKAFKICYPDLKTTAFEFCHYLYNKTMLRPEIYETHYCAFDVNANEASRALKELQIFN